MLKKAGIVVAAAAAGLLAISPLAFAGDKGDDHGHHGHGGGDNVNSVSDESETIGLVNVTDNNVNAPIQGLNCNDVPVQVGLVNGQLDDVAAALTGAVAIFGDAEAETELSTEESCTSTQGDSSAGDIVGQGIDD